MSQPQTPQDETQLPLWPQPHPAAIQSHGQPAQTDRTSYLAETLPYLKASIAHIYLTGRTSPFQDGPPQITRTSYMDMYSATHNYCDSADQWRKPGVAYVFNSSQGHKPQRWAIADLYVGLKDAIRTHCVDIRARLFAPDNSAGGIEGARRLLGEYVAHWNMLIHLANRIWNMIHYLEQKWIKRCMDEGQRDIHMIRDLHTMIWKEEVLHVGVALAEEATRAEMDRAVELLQQQGPDGVESDRDLVERFLESLRAVGLATVLAIR
jgi:hypothetical protein